MKKRHLLLASLSIISLLSLQSLTAFAINFGGVGGSPAYPDPSNPRTQSIFIFQLKPGQQTSNAVKVLNNTNQTQTVALDSVDSEIASGGTLSCRQAAEPKTDVGSWITFDQNQVTIGPNSSKIIPFTVHVPSGNHLNVGEHDGCITMQAASQTAAQSTQSGILLSFRSAIRVVVTIPGTITKNLAITQVGVSALASGQYQVSPQVKNEGNVSLDTTFSVQLIPILGVPAPSVKEGTSPVLPSSTASYSYHVTAPFWGGIYVARVTTTYNANPSTELGIMSHSIPQTKHKTSSLFFVAPSAIGGLIEAVILALIIAGIVWLVRKRHHRKHVRTHWKIYHVEAGDTVDSLAKDHQTSWKHIVRVNHLKPPYALREGQSIKLPPRNE